MLETSSVNKHFSLHLTALPWLHLVGENNNLDVLNYSSNTKGTPGPPKFPVLNVVSGLSKTPVRLQQATVGFRIWLWVHCSREQVISVGLHPAGSPFARARPRQGSLS